MTSIQTRRLKVCNQKKSFKDFSNEELKVFLYFSKTFHNPEAFYSQED